MDQHRKTKLPCKFELPDKPFLLYLVRFIVPVIVQTDLADSDHLIPSEQFSHAGKPLLIQLPRVVWMDSHRRIHKGIILHHIRHSFAGRIGRADIHDRSHSVIRHSTQKLFSVLIELGVVIMGMCIIYHQNSPCPSFMIPAPSYRRPALSSSGVFMDSRAGAMSNTDFAPHSPAFARRCAALA